MNSAQDPKSSQPAESERVQFLLSRQLDGDLPLDESSELTTLLQADAFRAWLAAATNLRSQLKALPVQPVSESFASSVRDAVHQSSNTTVAAPPRDRRRGWIMRGIVAVSVTAGAAALMLFLQRPDPERHDLAAMGAPTGGAPEATPATGISAPVDAAKISAASVPGELEAHAAPSTVAGLKTVIPQEQLRPFLENNDWRIVVVQVHSRDRDDVMRGIEAIVAQNGMAMEPIVGKLDQDARFGVLLTSSGANSDAFINSVLSESEAESADWNAQSIADSSRENLIHSLQESLKTPTHSELHFGQVYMMTLPKSQEPPADAAPLLLTQNDAVRSASAASTLPEKKSEPTQTLPETEAVRTTPVLVVFEFTDETPEHI